MPASLFQDPSSTYVYNYLQRPLSYSSPVAAIFVNGATYDTSLSTVGGCHLLLSSSKSQYLKCDPSVNNFTFPLATDGSGFTLAGWFFPTAVTTTGAVLVDISGASGQQRATLYYGNSTTLTASYNSGIGTTGVASSTVTVLPNRWNFFCWTIRCTGDSNTAYQTLYVNGIGSTATNNTATYAPYTVTGVTYGGRPNIAGSYFDGRLNEIRFYTRVLTLTEVGMLSNIYNYIGYLKSQGLVTGTNIPANSSFPLSLTSAYNGGTPIVYGDGLGTNGVAVQVDISGIFSYLSITRTPSFSRNDTNLFKNGVTMVDASYILKVPANAKGSHWKVSTTGQLTFHDNTVTPGQTYSYSFTPYIPDVSAAISPPISITTPTISPVVTFQSVYNSSNGAQTGKAFGLHGSQIQMDISSAFSYITVTRTPAFDASATVVSPGSVISTAPRTLQLYYSTKSTTAPTNATVYLKQQGASNVLALMDTTVWPGVQYSYNFISTLKGTSNTAYSTGTVNPLNTLTQGSTISLQTITLESTYDVSNGIVLDSTNSLNGAIVQIDISGEFTALDVSRNPAFDPYEVADLTETNTLRVYDASATLASTNKAYLSMGTTDKGVSGEVFIDLTAYPGATYTYSFVPYIRDASGAVVQSWNTKTNGNTITITTVSTGISALPVDSPYTPPSNGISATALTSNSIPGVTISSGAVDPTSGASAIGGYMGGGGGSGSGSGSSGSSGGSAVATGDALVADVNSDLSGPAATLAAGSSGLVTSVVNVGDPPSSVGLSGTGGEPAAPPATSPGTITLANGTVDGLYTGTLPSTVSTYFVAQTTSTGTISMGQAMTVPTPPAGQTGCSGTLSFFAWPAQGYDPGTTLTVLIGGVPVLSNYAFPSTGTGTDPYTPFNIPFSNLPAGNAQVTFLVTNANGTPNSSICMGGLTMSYSFTPGAGAGVTDTSGLALYYPFDVNSNVGTLVKNYSKTIPTLDASLNGSGAAIVSYTTIDNAMLIPAMYMGSGCLSLNGSSYVQGGAWTLPVSTASGGGGFSISGWFCATNTQTKSVLCAFQNSTNCMSIMVDYSSNTLSAYTNWSAGVNFTINTTLYLSTWYLFTVVYKYIDASQCTCSVYLGGTYVGGTTCPQPNTSSVYATSYIGGIPAALATSLGVSVNRFVGYMDDIRTYNRVLTTYDITSLWMYGMNNIIDQNVIDPTGLTLFYPAELAPIIT